MNFEILANTQQCRRASETSYVIVADVRKSTLLSQNGRQRDVNLVGAACIAAIRNLFPLGRVPYVFGGDGATFLVEESDLDLCLGALRSIQTMARRNLNIGLRVGHVTLSELRVQGADVYAGAVSAGQEELLTFLRGSGIGLADRLVKERDKSDDEHQRTDSVQNANLNGLACRLMPFQTRRGKVVSWIIDPLVLDAAQDQLFRELFSVLKGNEDFQRYCPVRPQFAKHKWVSSQWRSEAALNQKDTRLVTRLKSRFDFLIRSIMTKFVFVFDKFNSMTGLPSRYLEELPQQSDWVKASGALYLILDMTHEEQKFFETWLNEKEQAQLLRFGFHAADAAVITCHLHSSSHQRHFHFVDNTQGGLTAAATILKNKIKRDAK